MESLVLDGRQTIILSRNSSFSAAECRVVPSLAEGIALADTEQLFICGGAEIYRQALPLVETIYLTELLKEVAGDRLVGLAPHQQGLPHGQLLEASQVNGQVPGQLSIPADGPIFGHGGDYCNQQQLTSLALDRSAMVGRTR